MSALAGIVLWEGGPAGDLVRPAIAALALHGRDGEGVWEGAHAALGWRKTILHEEDRADEQPLTGGGGALRLVFDGRIDNREELARALGLGPQQARDWPDSAYVLAAFEKWGVDCPGKLLGDFAFAVWNVRDRGLFLARDPVGAKSLFLHRGAGFVMFASQPSALFTNPAVPRDLDDDSFIRILTGIPQPADGSLYRGISRIPRGTAILFRQKGETVTRHWRPEEIPELRYRRDEEYVEDMRARLDQAVACRLRSIHPVAAQLSAGWDSSAVTVTAARLLAQSGGTLTAFTAAPPEDWKPEGVPAWRLADESPVAASVARMYPNVRHAIIRGSGKLDLTALDRFADRREMPAGSVSNAGWIERLHNDARSRGIRTMLIGAMGNRMFSCDGLTLLPELLRSGRWLALARELRGMRQRGISPRLMALHTVAPNARFPVESGEPVQCAPGPVEWPDDGGEPVGHLGGEVAEAGGRHARGHSGIPLNGA